MSSSAVTLQCPACGGVFLTLQQGTGGAEICPHCSMSAPRARYRSVESQSSPGARAMLPPRRPETAPGTTSQPVPVLTAAMTPEAVPAERPAVVPTTLPPVRPGFSTGPVSTAPPQSFEPAAPTPVSTGSIPTYPPVPVTAPGLMTPVPTTEVNVLTMQLPTTAASAPAPPTVYSEGVPIPPVPPGEVPLPSRVLQTLATPTSSAPAYPAAQVPVASPFAVATGPAPEQPVPSPIAAPLAPQPPTGWEATPSQPPANVPAPVASYTAPPAPAYEPPPAASPALAHTPVPASPYEAPQPQPTPPPQYHYQQATQYAPAPSQLPVAYPPVPAPPPQVDPAAMAKASPAQLWEAAVLQHHHQAQDVSIMPTGRELFPTGSVPTFQPPPSPLGPVTFGPLTPPPTAEAPPVAAAPPPLVAPVYAPAPVAAPGPAAPSALPEGGFTAPRPGGTVLPTARSAPPAVPLHAYGVVTANPSAEPLPPPQIGFVAAPQMDPPAIPAEGPVPPSTSPFGVTTTAGPVEIPPLPPPPALNEPVATPTPDFVAALEQVQTQPPAQNPEPLQSYFTAAEPPAGSGVFASTEPPAISGVPPQAFVPGPVTHESTLLVGDATSRELHLPQTQHDHGQDLSLVAAKMVRSSGHAPAASAPASRSKAGPWIAGLLFGSLALGTGLHFLKDRLPTLLGTQGAATDPAQASNNSAPTPAPEIKKATAPSPQQLVGNTTAPASAPNPALALTPAPAPPPEVKDTPTPAPVTTAPVTTAPAPGTLPVPPAPTQEEVRRAMPSNPETLSISKEDPLPAIAAKLVFGIDSASTPEERAKWIADPEAYSDDMERLIRLRGGRLNTREVEPLIIPTSGPVHALPSGEAITLFRVASPASRGGAIVRLHAQNGNHLIDWPLFAQTYDNAFDRFVATNRAIPGKAEWYTVLCSLIGDPNAKNATREPRLRLKVQGSLAETGVTEAWVEKNSPAGRYLSEQMAPGHTYLIELQLGASDAGSRRLMVLDCAATRGESTQANANK